MAKVRTTASLADPAQAQLRDQLLTVFRDSRQLGESSAQLRQRLVGAVFGTMQNQIDTARSERFAASQASKDRKGNLIQTGVRAAIPVVGGAVTGGLAGGIAGGAQGAGLGALAGVSAGFGLPTSRTGSPAATIFERSLVDQKVDELMGGGTAPTDGGTVQKAIQPSPVPELAGTVGGVPFGALPEGTAAPIRAASQGLGDPTANIAAIAGLNDFDLRTAGLEAIAEDPEGLLASQIAAEILRRGAAF